MGDMHKHISSSIGKNNNMPYSSKAQLNKYKVIDYIIRRIILKTD